MAKKVRKKIRKALSGYVNRRLVDVNWTVKVGRTLIREWGYGCEMAGRFCFGLLKLAVLLWSSIVQLQLLSWGPVRSLLQNNAYTDGYAKKSSCITCMKRIVEVVGYLIGLVWFGFMAYQPL